MAEAAPTLARHDTEAKIVKRTWEDEAFRKEFLADPVGAFVKYLQVPAADLPKIVVHEETAGAGHIVLAPKPPDAGELSEEALEKVVGGTSPVTIITTVSVTVMTVGSGGSASYIVSKAAGW